MPQATTTRRFSVHAGHVDHHHARMVDEASFEAAAIAYAEDFHPSVESDSAISVIVREVETGRQHCYRIDLDSGETRPCG